MTYKFLIKSNIIFGEDSIDDLGLLLAKYEIKKIMVVYDQGVKAAGISDKVVNRLEEAGLEITIFDGVIPNPTNEIVEVATSLAKSAGIEGFVAVGGGSSIDLAKAVNVLMTNPGKIGDYSGIGQVKNEVLPLIAIPTTAGTSSEITNVSALIDTEKIIKYVVIDDKIIASDVLIDPTLTLTMPKSVTAATGMDGITHAIESYVSNMANPLTEYNSLKGLEILHKNITKVFKDGSNIEARGQMMLGCVITGFAFSNANLGLVHGIAHTLSAHFGLAHGIANAIVLPYVVEYNSIACPEKMVDLAKAIGLEVTGDLEIDKFLLFEELKRLNRELEIKTLSDFNIGDKEIEILAEDALKEPVNNFNPRQNITKEDVIKILKKAI